MGKIRIKKIGNEEIEQEEKKTAKKKREAKQMTKLSGMKGGERIAVVGPTEEEIEKLAPRGEVFRLNASQAEALETEQRHQPGEKNLSEAKSANRRTKKSKFVKAKTRSSNYSAKVMEIDKNKTYSLLEALELLRKIKLAKFDETVELHINTTEAGINGTVKLPHGTGKEIRIAIADDQILDEVEKGKINFDVLIAAPSEMPKLARVAKVLGPRGLMPNPKNGTISDKPEEAAKKFQGGQVSFKTESKVPLMHLTVGKMSFGDEKLSENIKTIIQAIKRDRIAKITLKSTMSPGIRLMV